MNWLASAARGQAPPIDDQPLTTEEREIIDTLKRSRGRPLTPEEINLSLEQALSGPYRRQHWR